MIQMHSARTDMFFLQMNNQLHRVAGGRRLTLLCSACGKKSTFYECQIDESLKAYFVVDLWKKTRKVLQCGECLAVCDYFDVFQDEMRSEEPAVAERKRKEAAEKAERKAEEERKLKEQAAHRRREEDQRRKETEIEDELARLKRKMGK
jgi:hypothetical protein